MPGVIRIFVFALIIQYKAFLCVIVLQIVIMNDIVNKSDVMNDILNVIVNNIEQLCPAKWFTC